MTSRHGSLTNAADYAPPHKRRAIARMVLSVAMVGLSVGLLLLGILSHMGKLDLEPVLSGSMRPTFNPGDLVAAWRVPMSSIKKGDIIMFTPPGSGRREMHRIVTIQRKGDKTIITTKGDANRMKDPWGRIGLRGKYAMKLETVIPKVGWVSQIPRATLVPLCLAVAGLVFIFSAFQRLRRRESEPEQENVLHQQSMCRGNLDFANRSRSIAPPTMEGLTNVS